MLVTKRDNPWDLGGPFVYLSEAWLREHWGRHFQILQLERFPPRPLPAQTRRRGHEDAGAVPAPSTTGPSACGTCERHLHHGHAPLGTSMVARVLKECGVFLGKDDELLPAGPENRDGFWESAALTRLNDEILAVFGGSWVIPPAMPDGWVDRPSSPAWPSGRGADRTAAGAAAWGWKDPRTSLTLPSGGAFLARTSRSSSAFATRPQSSARSWRANE